MSPPRWGRRIRFDHGRPARYEQGEQPTGIAGDDLTIEYLSQWPANSAPTAISYDESSIESNAMVALALSLVGGLDDDERGSGVWSIVDDPTSTFRLNANTGETIQLLNDPLAVGTYSVDVRYSGDHGGPPLRRTITVNVVRTDDPPTSIEFTPDVGAVQQTAPAGTKVFDLSLAGGSPLGSGTWALTSDPTGVLEITPTTGTTPIIRTTGAFPAAQLYTIQVSYSGEQGSGTLTASADINVDAVLSPPTALIAVPASATVQETLQPGSLLATLSLFGGAPTGSGVWSILSDPTGVLALALQPGNLSAQLQVAAPLPEGAYTVSIQYSGEQGSGALTLNYSLTVQDVTSQQPPTGIAATVQAVSVSETTASGTAVSTLSLTGGQPQGTGTWSLTNNAGGQLSISGSGTSVTLLTAGTLTAAGPIAWTAQYSGEQGSGALTYSGTLEVVSANQQAGVIWQTTTNRSIFSTVDAPIVTRATAGQDIDQVGLISTVGANQFRWFYSAALGAYGLGIEGARTIDPVFRKTLSSWSLGGTAADSLSTVASLSGDTANLIDIGSDGTISQTFTAPRAVGIIELRIYASASTKIALTVPDRTESQANADPQYWTIRDLASGWNTVRISDIERLGLNGVDLNFTRNVIVSTVPVVPATGVQIAIDRAISFRGQSDPLYHDAGGASAALDADIVTRDMTGASPANWYYEIGIEPVDLTEEGEDLVSGPFKERCIVSLNGGDPNAEIGVSHSNGVVYLYNRATGARLRVGALQDGANRLAWSPMTGACALNGRATAKIAAPTGTYTEERIGSSLVHGVLSAIVTVTLRANSGGPISDSGLQSASALSAAPTNYILPSAGAGNIQGGLLTANPGGWTGNPLTITYAYQWLRDGADISGATSSTYSIQGADVGARLSVRVTATNSSGSDSAASPETLEIVASGSDVVQQYSIIERSGAASQTMRRHGFTFAEGQVPRGYKIASRISGGSQIATANIMRNYWADGSLRNCGIVADSGSLGASSTRNMELVVVPDAGGVAAVNPWSWLSAWASDVTLELRNREEKLTTDGVKYIASNIVQRGGDASADYPVGTAVTISGPTFNILQGTVASHSFNLNSSGGVASTDITITLASGSIPNETIIYLQERGLSRSDLDFSLKAAAANTARREIIENQPTFLSVRCWDDSEPNDKHMFVTWYVDFHLSGSTVKAIEYVAVLSKPRLLPEGQTMVADGYDATVKVGGVTVETYPIDYHQHLVTWATLDQSTADVNHGRKLWINIDGSTAKPTVDVVVDDGDSNQRARKQMMLNGCAAPFDLDKNWTAISLAEGNVATYSKLNDPIVYVPTSSNGHREGDLDGTGGWMGRAALSGVDIACFTERTARAQRNGRCAATAALSHAFHYFDHRMADRLTALMPIPQVASQEFVQQAYPGLGKPVPHGLQNTNGGWPVTFLGPHYPHRNTTPKPYKNFTRYANAFDGTHVAKLAGFQAFWQSEQYLMDAALNWAQGTIVGQSESHGSQPRDNGLRRLGVPSIPTAQHRGNTGIFPSFEALLLAPANDPRIPMFKNYVASIDERYQQRIYRDNIDLPAFVTLGWFSQGALSDAGGNSKSGYRNRIRPWFVAMMQLYVGQYIKPLESAFGISLGGMRDALDKFHKGLKLETDAGRLFGLGFSNLLPKWANDGSVHAPAGATPHHRHFRILADGAFTHGYKIEDDQEGFPTSLSLPALANDDRLVVTRERLDSSQLDTLPTGLVENQVYWVVNYNAGFFQLSETQGGAPVNFGTIAYTNSDGSANLHAGVYAASYDLITVLGQSSTNDFASAHDTYHHMMKAAIEMGYALNLGGANDPSASNVFAWRALLAPSLKGLTWDIDCEEVRALPTAPQHDIVGVTATAAEGDQFTFRIDRAPATGATTVDWAVTGNGANPADAADFGGAFPSGTASFADGESSKTITFSSSEDGTIEPNEGFIVTLSNTTGGGTIGTATATGTIENDDFAAPTLAIAADQASANEGPSGSTPFTFTVTRSGNPNVAVTVDWAVTGSGANPAAADDFVGGVLPSGTLSLGVGVTTGTITVNVQGDLTAESNEEFTVTLSNPTGGASITTATAVSTITDDDTSSGWAYSDYANLTHNYDFSTNTSMTLSGTAITNLNDSEGTEHLAQATAANRPNFDATNGDTDLNVNSVLTGSSALATEIAAGGTIFVAFRPTEIIAATRYIFRVGSAGQHRVSLAIYNGNLFVAWNGTGASAKLLDSVFTLNGFAIVQVTRVGTTLKARVNGGTEGTGTAADTGTVDNIGVFGNAHNPTNLGVVGDGFRVLTLSDEPSEADRQRFEGKLAHDAGQEAVLDSGHPYRFTAP